MNGDTDEPRLVSIHELKDANMLGGIAFAHAVSSRSTYSYYETSMETAMHVVRERLFVHTTLCHQQIVLHLFVSALKGLSCFSQKGQVHKVTS